jgi:hypothetical protein
MITLNSANQFLSSASLRKPNVLVHSAWLRHGPFAFHLMANLAPRVFVELGTLLGYSYFCFCQAAKEYKTGTTCYGVDTWEGDEHNGFYSEEVYISVQRHNEPYSQFSTLMRMRFDEALGYFADGSVDLLHIDGRHYYDDVKEDFQTWLPKLSANAVVLFHDTNVRERNFGVFQLFHELSETYPTFEFMHGYGLGALAIGEVPQVLRQFFDADAMQTAVFRDLYSELGQNMADMAERNHFLALVTQKNAELANIQNDLERTRATLIQTDEQLTATRQELARLAEVDRVRNG